MALENLFIKVEKEIGGVQLDAVVSEKHTTSVKLTRYPVEFGSDVTDHAIVEPDRLKIIARVTDTPLGFAAVGTIVDSVSGVFGSSTEGSETRSTAAYKKIVSMQKERKIINIQTKLDYYQNMVIVSIDIVQNAKTSRVADMAISLESVIIVESKVSTVNLSGESEVSQASDPVSEGKKDLIAVEDDVNSSMIQKLRGIF